MSSLTRASLVRSPLSIRNWPGINNCCSHAKQPLLTCAAGLERGGEGRKRERGLGREGKGLALPFPFALFSPSPPLLSLRLFCACRAVFKTSSKKMKYLELYRKKKQKLWEFLNSILYICEANYQTAKTPCGLSLNYSTFIITSNVPQWSHFRIFYSIFYRAGWGMINIIIITISPTFNIFPGNVITNTTLGLEWNNNHY